MNNKTRKNAVVERLKHRLKVKSESLADQFEFRMYVAFVFKDSTKSPILYRATDIIPVMTNNYESVIMKAAKDSVYSVNNGKDLLEKDLVQLHASRYCCMHRGATTTVTSINFLIWPRRDIDHISCAIFSRWKGDENAPFQHIQQDFKIFAPEFGWKINQAHHQRVNETVVYNTEQSVFMLVHNSFASEKRPGHCNLSGLCIFLPQTKLMFWDMMSEEDVIRSFGVKTPT